MILESHLFFSQLTARPWSSMPPRAAVVTTGGCLPLAPYTPKTSKRTISSTGFSGPPEPEALLNKTPSAPLFSALKRLSRLQEMPMCSPDGAGMLTYRLKGAQGKFCPVSTRSTLPQRRVTLKARAFCLNCEESYFTLPLFNRVDQRSVPAPQRITLKKIPNNRRERVQFPRRTEATRLVRFVLH
jgi:hypothetical protein